MKLDTSKLAEISDIVCIPVAEAIRAIDDEPKLPEECRLFAALELASISTRGRHNQLLNQEEAAQYLQQSLNQMELLGPAMITNWLVSYRPHDSSFAIERDFALYARDFPSDESLKLCRDFLGLINKNAKCTTSHVKEVEAAFEIVPGLF